MAWLNQLGLEKFLLFSLVLTRVSGLVMTVPAFGTADIPAQVRVHKGHAGSHLTVRTQAS